MYSTTTFVISTTSTTRKYQRHIPNKCHKLYRFNVFHVKRSHILHCTPCCSGNKNSNPEEQSPLKSYSKSDITEPSFLIDKPTITPTQFAFGLSTIATAIVGGPVLAGFAIVFAVVGHQAEAPTWLPSVAAVICAAMTDTLLRTLSIDSVTDSGFIPYLLFVFGNAVVATVDFDQFFGMEDGKPTRKELEDRRIESTSTEESESQKLLKWDNNFIEKVKDEDTNL